MVRNFTLLICIGLGGCAIVPPAVIATPAKQSPIHGTAENSKSIYVSDFSVKLVDKKIGQLKTGTMCVGGQDLIWRDNETVLNSMREQISATFSENGYVVYQGLIKSRAENQADILVGVSIEEVKANICSSIIGTKGEASMTLRWEIVDLATDKSLSTATSGAASIPEFKRTGDPDVFVAAVTMATENLLAQPAFSDLTRK